METRRASKGSKKDVGILVSLAQTIGSTLGTVAAKADAFSKPPRRRKAAGKIRAGAVKARKKSRA